MVIIHTIIGQGGFFMDKSKKESYNSRAGQGMNLMEGRLFIILGIISFILILLVIRLFHIQLIKGETYGKRAFEQWFHVIGDVADRGTIYDRNSIPLTDKVKKNYLVLEPSFNLNDENAEIIVSLTGISRDELLKKASQNRKIELLINKYDKDLIINILRNKGVSTIHMSQRYAPEGLASHVVGYINEYKNSGVSGLEKSFNDELSENRGKRVGAILDAQNRIIPGFGYVVIEKGHEPKKNIVTTVDSRVQKICEDGLDKNNYIGSIVVLDRKSGEVLAMASRPNFEQSNVGDHLESNKKELFNKAVQISFPPGSVFKIIVAAALVENNIIHLDDRLVCEGYEMLGKNMIKCNSYERGGHGDLSFEEAFTLSCNSAFIQGAKALGGKKLIEMAKKFGIGEKTGIKLYGEVQGILPSEDYVKGAGIGNVAIGQGTVEVTPLQVARFTNVIANDGIDVGVRLVKEIRNDSGKVLKTFNSEKINRVISSDTSNKIKRMMKKVVEEGTGKRAKIDNTESYGKTGSAQAVGMDGETVHAWFTGFFFGKKSEYIITVIVEDERSGGRVATPLFSYIAKRMLEVGL